jgi:AcrR family transcriptional regulator
MKMKTRERILHASLALFNEFGESNVTTLQIADELEISPGNLYYHFKSKTDIVRELFGWYESQINNLLEVPEVKISIEDQWLFLHLIFETIAQYRFIYQDLINVLSRYEMLRAPFRRILKRKRQASRTICDSLSRQDILIATAAEIDSLCEQITLTTTYWLSFEMLAHLEEKDTVDLGRGVYQVMFLVAPYLRNQERLELESLGRNYLA